MSVDPIQDCVASLHLSKTLEEIGLNSLTVKRRRRAFLYKEHLHNVLCRLANKDYATYHFGSQTEGTTTPGLRSDLDMLFCLQHINIIQDWGDWEQGKENLLILQEDTAPGYCRLQLLRSDVPLAREDVPNINFTNDSRGRVIMKNSNTVLNVPRPGGHEVRNGPAMSESRGPDFIDTDFVEAFRCRSWPRQADESTRRHRPHGWPSERLIRKAVKFGCFLVAVGHKLSQTEQLEWRLSASFTERCLMFSLTIVHIKCYVVLKMLIKTFVEPKVKKCISSYHCKTAVLYCAENTVPGFWQVDNLLLCVTRCLNMLLTWVTDEFCPQFVFSEENLFAGKVTSRNTALLQSIFQDLIKDIVGSLLRVRIDDLGHNLQENLSTKPSAQPVLFTRATVWMAGQFENTMHLHRNEAVRETLLMNKHANTVPAIHTVYGYLKMLKEHMERAGKHERRAIETYIEFVACWLGSMLVSVALSRKDTVPRQAIKLFRFSAKSDIASLLKLVTVLFASGDLQKAETLLHHLQNHFFRSEKQIVCLCYERPNGMPLLFRLMIRYLRGIRTRATRFAHCVRFTLQEVHCVPPALRQELSRSIGDDIQHRHPEQDKWMDFAAVDCRPYLHYLQYITYSQLGKHDLQKDALNELEGCIKADNQFAHIETAWNLLGQCMELEKNPEAAMNCYRTFLKLRPRNNAANKHVQNLRKQ